VQNLRRISKIAPADGVPVKQQTLYKWWHIKKYPTIFVKLGGALFVDLDELAAVIEKHRG
jgi:hypothetical protein